MRCCGGGRHRRFGAVLGGWARSSVGLAALFALFASGSRRRRAPGCPARSRRRRNVDREQRLLRRRGVGKVHALGRWIFHAHGVAGSPVGLDHAAAPAKVREVIWNRSDCCRSAPSRSTSRWPWKRVAAHLSADRRSRAGRATRNRRRPPDRSGSRSPRPPCFTCDVSRSTNEQGALLFLDVDLQPGDRAGRPPWSAPSRMSLISSRAKVRTTRCGVTRYIRGRWRGRPTDSGTWSPATACTRVTRRSGTGTCGSGPS